MPRAKGGGEKKKEEEGADDGEVQSYGGETEATEPVTRRRGRATVRC